MPDINRFASRWSQSTESQIKSRRTLHKLRPTCCFAPKLCLLLGHPQTAMEAEHSSKLRPDTTRPSSSTNSEFRWTRFPSLKRLTVHRRALGRRMPKRLTRVLRSPVPHCGEP